MILTNVTKQLKAILPYYTDLFSNKNKIEYYAYLDKFLTIKTRDLHNLQANDFVILKGFRSKYKLLGVNYNQISGIMIIELPNNHEIFKTDKTIILQGFDDNNFNGEFPIIKLDDLTCYVQLASNLIPPLLNNNEMACKELPLEENNMLKVANIIDSHIFVVHVWLFDPHYDISNAYIVSSRVTATAEDPKTFVAKETQNRSYMYVTLSQVQINKKSTMDFSKSEDRFMIGDEISIYAVLPCINDTTGYLTTDIMRSEVFKAINKSILYGVFDNEQPNRLLTVSAVEQVQFAKAQLIYVFKYILPREITRENGFDRVLERRFRTLYFDIQTESQEIEAIIDMFKN